MWYIIRNFAIDKFAVTSKNQLIIICVYLTKFNFIKIVIQKYSTVFFKADSILYIHLIILKELRTKIMDH